MKRFTLSELCEYMKANPTAHKWDYACHSTCALAWLTDMAGMPQSRPSIGRAYPLISSEAAEILGMPTDTAKALFVSGHWHKNFQPTMDEFITEAYWYMQTGALHDYRK